MAALGQEGRRRVRDVSVTEEDEEGSLASDGSSEHEGAEGGGGDKSSRDTSAETNPADYEICRGI